MMRRIIDARLTEADEAAAMEIGMAHLRRESAGGSPIGYAAVKGEGGGWEVNLSWQMRSATGGRTSRKRYVQHSAKVVGRDDRQKGSRECR